MRNFVENARKNGISESKIKEFNVLVFGTGNESPEETLYGYATSYPYHAKTQSTMYIEEALNELFKKE